MPNPDDYLNRLLSFANEYDLPVTSTTGGKHVKNSLHYHRRAIDTGPGKVEQSTLLGEAKKRGFRVLPELYTGNGPYGYSSGPHYHIEVPFNQGTPMPAKTRTQAPTLDMLRQMIAPEGTQLPMQGPQMYDQGPATMFPFSTQLSQSAQTLDGHPMMNGSGMPFDYPGMSQPEAPPPAPEVAGVPPAAGNPMSDFWNQYDQRRQSRIDAINNDPEYAYKSPSGGQQMLMAILTGLAGGLLGRGMGTQGRILPFLLPMLMQQRYANQKEHYSNLKREALQGVDKEINDQMGAMGSYANAMNTAQEAALKPRLVDSQIEQNLGSAKASNAAADRAQAEIPTIAPKAQADIDKIKSDIVRNMKLNGYTDAQINEITAKIDNTKMDTWAKGEGVRQADAKLAEDKRQFGITSGQKNAELRNEGRKLNQEDTRLGIESQRAVQDAVDKGRLRGADADKAYGLMQKLDEAENGTPGGILGIGAKQPDQAAATAIRAMLQSMGIKPPAKGGKNASPQVKGDAILYGASRSGSTGSF